MVPSAKWSGVAVAVCLAPATRATSQAKLRPFSSLVTIESVVFDIEYYYSEERDLLTHSFARFNCMP